MKCFHHLQDVSTSTKFNDKSHLCSIGYIPKSKGVLISTFTIHTFTCTFILRLKYSFTTRATRTSTKLNTRPNNSLLILWDSRLFKYFFFQILNCVMILEVLKIKRKFYILKKVPIKESRNGKINVLSKSTHSYLICIGK